MNTYFYILQKHLGAKKIIYPDDPYEYWSHIFGQVEKAGSFRESLSTSEKISNVALYQYIHAVSTEIEGWDYDATYEYFDSLAHSKFENIKPMLVNDFLKQNQDYILEIIRKTQRTYWGFSSLARRFRLNRAPLQINNDLYLNPIDDKTRSMVIFQNGAKYRFKLSDLMNIVNVALTNASYFFAEPLFPKNPYTNMEFSRGVLLEIYIQSRESNFKLPILLHAFFLAEFNLDEYVYNNEALIRDIHIENYVKKSSAEDLHEEVTLMIDLLDTHKKLFIHEEFPKQTLVDVMRPYLHLYLIHEYSLNYSTKRNQAFLDLTRKFKRFINHNPLFGRKHRKFIQTENGKKKYINTFNDNHLPF